MSKSLLRSSLVALLFVAAVLCGRGSACAQTPTPAPTPDPGATVQASPSPTPATLTANEKMEAAARSAFLNPLNYAMTGAGAAYTEVRERDQPHKDNGDRFADGLSRFAINFATGSTSTMLGSGVYPVLFKQDPRYHPSGKKGFGPRTAYAVSRVFVTRGDDGSTQPNYSRLAGNFSASALANIWERDTPGSNRTGARPTLRRFGTSIGSNMVSNIILKEFWPDIMRLLGRQP
jgi:hypothetical protein